MTFQPIPTLILTLLLCVATPQATADTSLTRIVFTPWADPPETWIKYSDDSLRATNPKFFDTKTASKPFQHTLFTPDFTYVFSAPVAGKYTLRIGSIENTGCVLGRRGFQYSVNRVSSGPFSVSELVGCDTPYFTDIPFEVSDDLLVTVKFEKLPGKWMGSISNFELFEGSVSPVEYVHPVDRVDLPTSVPAAASTNSSRAVPEAPKVVSGDIERDVGPALTLPGTRSVTHSGTISTTGITNIPPAVFSTSRQGQQFELEFDVEPGTYDIELGFVETTECEMATRVFNVHINGNSRLEAYDIFQEAGACRKAIVETFKGHSVDPLIPEPIAIQFSAVAGDATLSFVRIKASRKQCVPVTNVGIVEDDHAAHAVAGTYPKGDASSFVDRASRGFVSVNIDGSGSHTHFSYNGKSGIVTSYEWTLMETGKLISTQAKFTRNFPMGTTRLKLSIVDNGCSQGEDETSVSVSGNMQPGPYCYYYQGLDELPLPGTLLQSPRPSFSASSTNTNFDFPSFPFDKSDFVARCLFSVETDTESPDTIISVKTGGSGVARLYEGEDLIIDSETTTESGPIFTAVGLVSFEVIYKHTDMSKTPSLTIMVDGKVPNRVLHDQSTVMPIITSVTPPTASIEGGAKTKIRGYGLFHPLTVNFGTESVDTQEEGATSKSVFTSAPPSAGQTLVDLTVETNIGTKSNPLKFSYSSICDDVKFTNHEIKRPDGSNLNLTQPTAVSIWQDGKIYMASRVGIIEVVEYDPETLVTKSVCHSETFTDPEWKRKDGTPSERTFLGITFDPRDKVPRPYVSASTLDWEKGLRKGNGIDRENKRAWSNGAVERFKPSSAVTRGKDPNQCLEHDRTIVSNLPVADGDHSVNELVFTQEGDLLIAVGGFTNMGLPHAMQTGNWETYFSASVLIAELSKGASFNGVIPYTTPENLRTAAPKDGYTDVRIHATGVRNLFSMAMARTGKVYALDMGPNCEFGNASSTCSEYNEPEAALRSTSKFLPFPGQAIVGPPGKCRYNDDRPDKLIEIKRGKFYGHSNLQRGVLTQQPGECAWVDPLTGRTPPPFDNAPPVNYEHHMALVRSPKTGIREYGGNLFCGRLRGDLIISQINSRGVWRAPLSDNGELDGKPFMFHTKGGLRVEENAQGDLLYPIYGEQPKAPKGIFVMKPMVTDKSGMVVANAVPFRHGRAGGTRLIIGGWGFETGAEVSVGGLDCPVVSVSATEIVCTVPRFRGGSSAVGISVSVGGVESSIPEAVLYMAV